jgi:hypothetical protein
MKSPLADLGAGEEERPRRATIDFEAVRRRRSTENDLSHHPPESTAWSVLQIASAKDDAQIPPRMIMQRAIVVRAPDVVQIHVAPSVMRDEPPAQQVGVLWRADDQIGLSHSVPSHETVMFTGV